ncbi:STM4015 family protein [Streptomyces oceani]|uniref:Cytoplasmic protein n=1 Tax=Streptomyces oceani TaxID=1075402 RepID=A0A1E7JXE9_9ACTN|nr:STM4015 family protein [Streptomyces oceani]OEU96356.1 cytoplasmic protein [Streptomyces oceani]
MTLDEYEHFDDHPSEFHGLEVWNFDGTDAVEDLPAPGDVAWYLAVDWVEDDASSWTKRFQLFLDTVGPTGVRALVIGQWGAPYAHDSSEPIDAITAVAARLPELEAVFVGDISPEEAEISWIEQSDVTKLLTAFPQLTELRVRGGTKLEFPPVTHERLRSLVIVAGGIPRQVVRGIGDSQLPALERLDLWLGVSEYSGDTEPSDLEGVLAGKGLPALKHLALCNSEIQDEVAAALATAPVVAQLDTLDISKGTLGDDGATALVQGQPLTHLTKLDLDHNFLSEAMEQRLIDTLSPHGVEVMPGREDEDDFGDGELFRFTAVAE